MSQGVRREAGKPSLGIAVSHPLLFRLSIVGFSIFDFPPNHISCFPEQLQHLQLSLTSSKNESKDCQEGDARVALALMWFIHLDGPWASNNARQAPGQAKG